MTQLAGVCSDVEARNLECYGGFARLASLVRRIREAASAARPVLFLNAGDTYQGSELFSHYGWSICARFLDMLRLDVMVSFSFSFSCRSDGAFRSHQVATRTRFRFTYNTRRGAAWRESSRASCCSVKLQPQYRIDEYRQA